MLSTNTEKIKNAKSITLPAFAKINLYLDITGVLPNGYHSLNNIMQQIDLHDDVTVSFEEVSETSIEVTCDNSQIPCDERNIAYKAAKLFLSKTERSGKVKVDIKKSIPIMAGLGGSSTDGGAVLVALNKLCDNPFSREQLEAMGAGLGADVPFCIRGNCAYCKGIGDIMTDIKGVEQCSILIVKPIFSTNTSAAYKLYDQNQFHPRGEPSELLNALKREDLKETSSNLYNIFEELNCVQEIKAIKKDLMEQGALAALLSGSGSSVYGIFSEEESAGLALQKLNYPTKLIAKPV